MYVEKRKHKRLKINLEAKIEYDKSVINGKTRNISFGGLFFELKSLHDRLKEGDICNLTVMLNTDDAQNIIPLEFQCKVVHCRKHGYGMQFICIEGLEAYDHFEKMMVLNSDESEQLMAELEKHPGLIVKDE